MEKEKTATTTPPWPELLGSKQWSDLLDPLDLSLRNLILLCGDLCQVCYDAFDSDVHSKYCGASRYGRRSLLARTAFPSASDFLVPSLLYATSDADLPASFLLFSLSREAWSRESNWIGYVAVSSDASARATGQRKIFVVWRGTLRDLEWIDVLHPELTSIESILSTTTSTTSTSSTSTTSKDDDDHRGGGKPKVMKGWHTIYTSSDPKSPFTKTSARDQLFSKIRELLQLYKDDSLSIVCVGHSLGASLAILSAFDLVENGLSKSKLVTTTTTADSSSDRDKGDRDRDREEEFFLPVCAIVFGSPQVGNKAFQERLEKLPNLRVLHVKHKNDMIPLYPTRALGYVYTGIEFVVDASKSPYLKDSKNPGDWHNLQGILHSVAGWNGEDGEFELKVERSIAIVNKSCDYLKDECLVPGSWWVEKNRGMVRREDGEWELATPSDDDDKEDDVPAPVYLKDGTGADKSTAAVGNDNNKSRPAGSSIFASCFGG